MAGKKGKANGHKGVVTKTLLVLAIVFVLAGAIGFMAAAGLLVLVPFVFGAAGAKGEGIRGRWGNASRPQKITITTILLLMTPLFIVGILWLCIGGSDFLIDAVIILPVMYVAIWFLWGRKRKQANYREEGASYGKGSGMETVQKLFSNNLMLIICVAIIAGILIFSGVNFGTTSSSTDKAKDTANLKGSGSAAGKTGLVNPMRPMNITTNTTALNKLINATANVTLHPPTVTYTITNVTNITIMVYDQYTTTLNWVYTGDAADITPVGNGSYSNSNSTTKLAYLGDKALPVLLISGVTVKLVGVNDDGLTKTFAQGTSNKSGMVSFKKVIIGQYDVVCEMGGYAPFTYSIDLGSSVGTYTKVVDKINDTASNVYLYWKGKGTMFMPLAPLSRVFDVGVVLSQHNYTQYYYNVKGAVVTYQTPQNGMDAFNSQGFSDIAVQMNIALESGTSMKTLKNVQRQQSMWGWTGLPQQVGFVNGIVGGQQQMQSMFNSMFTLFNSVLPELQSIQLNAGQTYIPNDKLAYIGMDVKMTNVSEIAATRGTNNGTIPYPTYMAQLPSANRLQSKAGALQVGNLTNIQDATTTDTNTKSIFSTRTYRYIALTPHGGDIQFGIDARFMWTQHYSELNKELNTFSTTVNNLTLHVSQTVTLTSSTSPTQTGGLAGTNAPSGGATNSDGAIVVTSSGEFNVYATP